MPDIAAIILAAGKATRFGAAADTTKAIASWRGKPLVRWVAEAALVSRATEVVVVTGHAAAGVEAALVGLGLRCVRNEAYADGMAGSLRVGVETLPGGIAGTVVLLADMPLITPAIIDALIATFENDGARAGAVVPVYRERRGNPVLLGRSVFGAVKALTGDQGARQLFAGAAIEVLTCPVEDEAVAVDIDTPAALEALDEREA